MFSSDKEPTFCLRHLLRSTSDEEIAAQVRLQTAVKNAEREVIQAEAGRRTLILAQCQYCGTLKSLKIKGNMKKNRLTSP